MKYVKNIEHNKGFNVNIKLRDIVVGSYFVNKNGIDGNIVIKGINSDIIKKSYELAILHRSGNVWKGKISTIFDIFATLC